jgi:PKD repeat protein
LSATPTSGTAALLVSANTTGSNDPDGTIASTKLDFGDGTILDAASGSHTYANAGAYILKATVTDNMGASASTTSTITVQAPANQAPIAKLSLTPTSGTAALTVTASTTGSSDPDGTIASTKIDFGDGTVLAAASGTHVYSTAGSFIVKATVSDNKGTSASASSTVTVQAPAQTAVTISAPLNNATVSRWVTVSATATSSISIKVMQLYVDGVKKVEVAGSKLSTLASLTAGAHRITVQSVDVNGGLAKSTVYVTAN